MSLSPSMPSAPNPAKRPERSDTVQPEDIVVGTEDSDSDESKRGRRALRRPSGNVQGGGESVGTGLNA